MLGPSGCLVPLSANELLVRPGPSGPQITRGESELGPVTPPANRPMLAPPAGEPLLTAELDLHFNLLLNTIVLLEILLIFCSIFLNCLKIKKIVQLQNI